MIPSGNTRVILDTFISGKQGHYITWEASTRHPLYRPPPRPAAMEEGDVGKTRWLFANTANTTAEERVGARGLKCSLHVPSFLCKNISYISRQAPVFIHVHNLCIYIYIFYIYFFVLFIHIYI